MIYSQFTRLKLAEHVGKVGAANITEWFDDDDYYYDEEEASASDEEEVFASDEEMQEDL